MTDLLLRQSDFADLAEVDVASAAVGRPAPQIDLEFVDSLTGFDLLAQDWDDLFKRAGRPEQVFQSYAWNWHWTRHYLRADGSHNLAIVTGRAGGRLVLVMPLVVERRSGLKQLVWLGEPVSQYGDVLAAPEAQSIETLVAAWTFAVDRAGADVANLRKVRADSVAAPLLAHIGARIVATEEAPYLDFRRAGNHAAFEQGISAKGRKNRRRHLRRLEERGSIAFERHSGTEEAGKLAAYAILLKRAWLKSRDQISMAMTDDRFAAFFRDVAEGGRYKVDCQVLALRSCNEVAALQLLLGSGDTRFLHVAVYATKFEKNGVGGLLLEHAVAECFKDRIGRLDLLAPKHEYKLEFAEATIAVSDHAVALSMLGRAYSRGYLGVRRKLKAVVEGMPAPARRAFAGAIGLLKGRA